MSVTFTSFYQTNNADFEKWKNSVDKGKFSGALLKISQRHLDIKRLIKLKPLKNSDIPITIINENAVIFANFLPESLKKGAIKT